MRRKVRLPMSEDEGQTRHKEGDLKRGSGGLCALAVDPLGAGTVFDPRLLRGHAHSETMTQTLTTSRCERPQLHKTGRNTPPVVSPPGGAAWRDSGRGFQLPPHRERSLTSSSQLRGCSRAGLAVR